MPLKWFGEWTEANPVDVIRPAFLVGIPGGALVLVALLVANDVEPEGNSFQTGPRGTGMHVHERELTAAQTAADIMVLRNIDGAPAATAADQEDAALAPAEGSVVPVQADAPPAEEEPSGDLAATIVDDDGTPVAESGAPEGDAGGGVLPDQAAAPDVLTAETNPRLVAAMREWTGIPNLLDGSDSYQNAVALRMIQMTQSINSDWEGHVSVNEQVGVTCYTCHRGQPVPSGIWFEGTPVTLATAGWASVQNRATAVSQSTSLPSDALYQYLLEGNQITVHDLESRVAGRPSDEGYRTIQDTERTFSLMNYFANSLGVNCTFCHNTRAFYDVGQVTPQWSTASLGIAMVLELNELWLVPVADLLPPERLGPQGDGPKLACNTCHKGAARPLGGTDVIGNWPELASSEPAD